MEMRRLGVNGPPISAVGPSAGDVGLLRAGGRGEYCNDPRGDDRGVTLLNTGEFYGMGHNRTLDRAGDRGAAGSCSSR